MDRYMAEMIIYKIDREEGFDIRARLKSIQTTTCDDIEGVLLDMKGRVGQALIQVKEPEEITNE